MARKRRSNHGGQASADRRHQRTEPRLPPELQSKFASAGLELARQALASRQWRQAYDFAEASRSADPPAADAMMAESSARQARHAALCGQFTEAAVYARRAGELRPGVASYQERRRLINLARGATLQDSAGPLFPDTIGPTGDHWWHQDLLSLVRGRDGGMATVPAPLILDETRRDVVSDIYAVGMYQPWHVAGSDPLFTRYVRALKPGGRTVPYAAMLLRQGLTEERDWIEDVDVIVPMATSLRSYERRGFELTEDIARELALRLCIPLVDLFEVDPYAEATHAQRGYRERAQALAASLRVKAAPSALLREAEAVLVVDDVVTYGATFEACARRLREYYPQLRVYGAALAYTQTPQRLARATEERADLEGFRR